MVSRVHAASVLRLELDGIRYEEIMLEQYKDIDRRSGYMRAREIASGKVLWEGLQGIAQPYA